MSEDVKHSAWYHYQLATHLIQKTRTNAAGMTYEDVQSLLQIAQIHASLYAGRVVEEQTERLKHG